jgi:hypothetical protein
MADFLNFMFWIRPVESTNPETGLGIADELDCQVRVVKQIGSSLFKFSSTVFRPADRQFSSRTGKFIGNVSTPLIACTSLVAQQVSESQTKAVDAVFAKWDRSDSLGCALAIM